MSIPLALSIHNFIHSVGADCGFAAIIGLALVVILFFAHARETANLRDGLDDAHERIEALQQQLQQVRNLQASQPRAAAGMPAPAPGGVPPVAPRPGSALRTTAAATAVAAGAGVALASRAGSATAAPAALQGQGAPSLGSATKLIPDPAAINGDEAPANGFVNGETMIGAPAVAAAAGAGTAAAAAPRPAGMPEGQIPRRTAPPANSRAGGSLLDDEAPRRRTWLIVLSSIVALAVIVVILLVALGGGGGGNSASTTPHKHKPSKSAKAPALQTGKYHVAVLNGTAVSGLAADVFGLLKKQGYKQGAITNAATQTETSSVVYYVHDSDRLAANQVAATLGINESHVKPVTSAALQSCGTSPTNAKTNCTANVIVSVGSDQASLAQSTTSTSA